MPISKSNAICKWKRSGLICDNYDELYEVYIKTTECEHCKTEFTEKNKRCLDHDHTTGLFRKIVCNRCNVNDSYIKYPNGFTEQDRKEYQQEYQRANKEQKKEYSQEYSQEYYQKNKQKISAQRSQKIECECGVVVSRANISIHKRSKKHSLYKLNNLV